MRFQALEPHRGKGPKEQGPYAIAIGKEEVGAYLSQFPPVHRSRSADPIVVVRRRTETLQILVGDPCQLQLLTNGTHETQDFRNGIRDSRSHALTGMDHVFMAVTAHAHVHRKRAQPDGGGYLGR